MILKLLENQTLLDKYAYFRSDSFLTALVMSHLLVLRLDFTEYAGQLILSQIEMVLNTVRRGANAF